MGGNLFKITRRYKNDEYQKIYPIIIKKLKSKFETEFYHIHSYRNKETHGDVDILMLIDDNRDIREDIKNLFSTEHIHKNGNVLSFIYIDLQVDLILTSSDYWESAKGFFPEDPSGNLMGKYAHSFGLKYGFHGLVYPYRGNSGTVVKDIVISQDQEKIHRFFDLDFDRYKKGFDTVEDIFEYIIKSKYFNAERFQFDNLTGVDRKRNKKRATYNGFFEYINSKNYTNEFIFNKDKSVYLEVINNYFPEANLFEELEELKRVDERNKLVKEKFNGRLVMEKFNIKGKELGLVMKSFFEKYDDDYILSNSQEKLLYKIKEIINKNK